jgi:26S proteasome regulatory subunit N2
LFYLLHLGIACAGTGSREAIALLEPLAKFDPVNFVRQGALVSFKISVIFIFELSSNFKKIMSGNFQKYFDR